MLDRRTLLVPFLALLIMGALGCSSSPTSPSSEEREEEEGTLPQGPTWELVQGPARPSPRYYTAAAYDTANQRLILFGGVVSLFEPFIEDATDTFYASDTWAYDVATNTWEERKPANSPPARQNQVMAYDSKNDLIVLFGGSGNEGPRSDTWAYDPDTNTWQQMNAVGGVPPFAAPYGCYATWVDRLIIFGGQTWIYDLESDQWTNPQPPTNPPEACALTCDAESQRVIAVDGRYPTKVWAYDFETNQWEERSPTTPIPYRRSVSFSLSYDSAHDRVVLFGGADESGRYTNETWAYDTNANTWQKIEPSESPPILVRLWTTYDPDHDLTILTSGVGVGLRMSDIWTFDIDQGTWNKAVPSGIPPERYGAAIAYDSESRRVILFGGFSSNVTGTRLDDTWAYDPESKTWTEMSPSVHPDARQDGAMAYDSLRDRVLLVAGPAPDTGKKDVWTYDFNSNTWERKGDFPGTDLSRHAISYDSESDRVVLFGDQGLWIYEPETDSWSQPAGGTSVPSSRVGARLAYDSESDRVVLFGGYANETRLADTWAYDTNTNTWEEKAPETSPSARYGFGMTYDPTNDLIVLLGGTPATDEASQETWTYDFNTNQWSLLTVDAAPSARLWPAMVSQGESGLLLFSGLSTTEGLVDDVWEIQILSDGPGLPQGSRPAILRQAQDTVGPLVSLPPPLSHGIQLQGAIGRSGDHASGRHEAASQEGEGPWRKGPNRARSRDPHPALWWIDQPERSLPHAGPGRGVCDRRRRSAMGRGRSADG